MQKNTADQVISFQMLSATDFSSITTGTPTVYITGDGDTQETGSGAITHEGNGIWSYEPTQAETNYDYVSFTMVLATAIQQTESFYTTYNLITDIWDKVITGGWTNNSAAKTLRNLLEYEGYSGGFIWIDTTNGTSGTESYVNGTVNNPVNSWADALTLAGNLEIKKFNIASGNTITLTSNVDGCSFTGCSYTIDLNDQSVSGTSFYKAIIVGNDAGTNADSTCYEKCIMGDNTLGQHRLKFCAIRGNITLAEATTYIWNNCQRVTDNLIDIVVDFGEAIGNTTFACSDFTGIAEIKNLGANGTDIMAWGANGTLILNANCVGGTLLTAGVLKLVDNSNEAVTISEEVIISVYDIFNGVLADLSDDALNVGEDITLTNAIRALFNRFYREVNQTATTQIVKNDSGDQIASMAVSDDGTTQTKATAT